MTVSFRKRNGLPSTQGGVAFCKVQSGVLAAGPRFYGRADSNKATRYISRCRSVRHDALRVFQHQELILPHKHPTPIGVGKLHNDVRNVPYGIDTKWKAYFSPSHVFTTKLSMYDPMRSEQKNSQKWLQTNESVRAYYLRLEIFHLAREKVMP